MLTPSLFFRINLGMFLALIPCILLTPVWRFTRLLVSSCRFGSSLAILYRCRRDVIKLGKLMISTPGSFPADESISITETVIGASSVRLAVAPAKTVKSDDQNSKKQK